jgi:hypothetical protein
MRWWCPTMGFVTSYDTAGVVAVVSLADTPLPLADRALDVALAAGALPGAFALADLVGAVLWSRRKR